MSGGFHKLRDLLDGAVGRFGIEAPVEVGILWSRWAEVVGDAVAAHAEPTSLKNGVLRVRTDSPSWATELGYMADQIVEGANRLTGKQLVTEVRVWTSPDPVKKRRGGPRPVADRGPREHPRAVAEVSPEESPMEALEAAREAWSRGRSGGSRRGPEKA